VDSTTVEHRLAAEGADYLLLAGVNDANLQEFARLSGCRVILRGDNLILSGDVNDVERALPVASSSSSRRALASPSTWTTSAGPSRPTEPAAGPVVPPAATARRRWRSDRSCWPV
jgi:hypothetical protein